MMKQIINKIIGPEQEKQPPIDLQCYINNFNGPGCKVCPFLNDCKTHHDKKKLVF